MFFPNSIIAAKANSISEPLKGLKEFKIANSILIEL
jgi:hypothetical protein